MKGSNIINTVQHPVKNGLSVKILLMLSKSSCATKVCILNIVLAVDCAVVPQGAVTEADAPIRGVNRLNAEISLEKLLVVE